MSELKLVAALEHDVGLFDAGLEGDLTYLDPEVQSLNDRSNLGGKGPWVSTIEEPFCGYGTGDHCDIAPGSAGLVDA